MAILPTEYFFCKYLAVTAILLIKQNPFALIVSAWCPGGLTAQKIFLLNLIKSSAAAIPEPQALSIASLLCGHNKVSAYGSCSTPINPSFGIFENISSTYFLGWT